MAESGQRKATRLRFKKRENEYTRKGEACENNVSNADESPCNSGKQAFVPTEGTAETVGKAKVERRPSKHYKSGNTHQMSEYGTEINGYRFVALGKEDIPEDEEEIDGEREAEDDSNDDGEETYEEWERGPVFTYEAYVALWQAIEEDCTLPGYIPLPIASSSASRLTVTAVGSFLHGEPELIRAEKIRWHPDRMVSRLQRLGVTEDTSPGFQEVVTRVFQAINELS